MGNSLELPNLPGITRDLSAMNPRLYRDFKASQNHSSVMSNSIDDDSLMSHFEDPESRAYISQHLKAFPDQGSAYNDIRGRYSMCSQKADRLQKTRSLPYCSLDRAPSFVVDNDITCRFLAYFTDRRLPDEIDTPQTKRTRKVEIHIHLEDSTIEITEPQIRNSGLPQGKIIKRHTVNKPNSSDIFTIEDMKSGAQLFIYKRNYTIVDCDNYTRKTMNEMGIEFGPPLPLPSDTYVPPQPTTSKRSGKHVSRKETEGGFYEHGIRVLRFFGLWDDSGSLYGDKVLVRLHYFLADDSMEVLPVNERNTGRDRIAKFLKRTKVPLTNDMSGAANTILQDGEPIPTYHWKDLSIGCQICVGTFVVDVLDADEFTRCFFEMKGQPLAAPIVIETVKHQLKERPTMSSEGLIGEETEKDGAKLQMYGGIILRYMAKICDPQPEDIQRRFVIQVHLEDDTIQILEPPIRNSGIKGGTFLKRGKVSATRGGRPIDPTEIYLGATPQILSHRFEVFGADNYTLKYMEAHDYRWTICQVSKVINKIKAKASVVKTTLLTIRGLSDKQVSSDELEEIFTRARLGLVKQEVTSLFRSMDTTRSGLITLASILGLVLG
jgi:hypothetical protein